MDENDRLDDDVVDIKKINQALADQVSSVNPPEDDPEDGESDEGRLLGAYDNTDDTLDTPSDSSSEDELETKSHHEPIALVEEEEPATIGTGGPTVVEPSKPRSSSRPAFLDSLGKKRLPVLIGVGLVVIVLAGALIWWFMSRSDGTNDSQPSNSASTTIEQPPMEVTASLIEGSAEYMRGESEWQELAVDTKLQPGDSVRTAINGRVVLDVADGSVIRLDIGTTIKLVSLAPDDVRVEQVNGAVYSRVKSSERAYVVSLGGDTDVKSTGTAFVTYVSEIENGVRVFEGAVRIDDLVQPEIGEGKQVAWTTADAVSEVEAVDINIQSLIDDKFINWNVNLDEKHAVFKNSLGILPQIKQRAEALEKERIAAEEAATKVTRGAMALSASETSLNWSYTGKALYGYRLVYSETNTEPVFGTDKSLEFNDKTTTANLTKDNVGVGKFNVRVCAFTDEDSEPCVDYSAPVVVEIE